MVTVTSAFAEPTNGGSVAFVGPLTGAGLTPITTTAIITNDVATANVTANGIGGSYPVNVSTTGASASLTFNLTNTYLITPTAGAHGTITPGTPQMVNAGDSITFTIAADTGYHITDVGVDGASQGPIPSYTFDNIMANHTITADFAIDTFVITPTAGLNGSITPSTPQTLNYGDSITFTITPDANYHIVDVGIDGASQGPIGSYMFENVTANHTITAAFAIDTFVITPTTGLNGSITPDTPQSVNYGDSITFTIAADTGYYIVDVGVDGVSQGPIPSYTFDNVMANHIITADFAIDTFVITPTAGLNGSITPGTPQTVNYGDSITFTVAADIGYHITDVGVDGLSQGPIDSYTFENVTANHTISAAFAIDTFVITPTAGLNGSITPGTPQTVNYGDSITFTVAADTGYHIVDVGVDGVSQGPIPSYTFDNVMANHTITAAFAINTYTLTVATVGSGSGVVTPTIGVHTYAYGTVITLTASANLASSFSGWSGACSNPTGACVVTLDADKSVIANFTQYRLYLPLAAKNF